MKDIFDSEDSAKKLNVHRNMIFRYVASGRLKPLFRNKSRRGDILLFSRRELEAFQKPKRGRPRKKGVMKNVEG